MPMAARLLLTGPPRVGKTTLVRQVVSNLGERAGGFYTQEVRDASGRRAGFRIVTLAGEAGWLARLGRHGNHCLGKYAVDVAELDRLGVSAIRSALAQKEIVVIDEIGPMELFSEAFRAVVLEALSSPTALLATIVARPHPWADGVKRTPHVQLIHVTVANRDRLAVDLQREFG